MLITITACIAMLAIIVSIISLYIVYKTFKDIWDDISNIKRRLHKLEEENDVFYMGMDDLDNYIFKGGRKFD